MTRPERCPSTWRGHRCNQEAGHAGRHTRDSAGPDESWGVAPVALAEADTWPERQGIPTLERVLENLAYVERCLGGHENRQVLARGRLAAAREWVSDAIGALRGEG